MNAIREVKEGRQRQGVDESIAYTITTTPWGSAPSAVAVVVYDVTPGTRTVVTTTVMPAGSPSVIGDVITLPPLTLLTDGKTYRVEVKFTCSGNVFETFIVVEAEQ